MKSADSEPLTWAYINTLEDLDLVREFLTPRQEALLILAQSSDSILIQMLVSNGFATEESQSRIFTTVEYAEWLDSHFKDIAQETLEKCAVTAFMEYLRPNVPTFEE